MVWYRRLPEEYQTPGVCDDSGDCSPPAPRTASGGPIPFQGLLGNDTTDNQTHPRYAADASIPFQVSKNQLKIVLHVVSIVLAICLLFFIYHAVLHFRRALRRRRRRRNAWPNSGTAGGDGDANGDEDDAVAGEDVHHIWYIRTVGLDQNTIDSIKVFRYKSGNALIGNTDCSVCLGEFCEGEDLRLLPKCGHAFHISCIDTWLRSHVSCPLCRAPVVLPSPPDPPPAITTDHVPHPISSSASLGSTPEGSNPHGESSSEYPLLQANVGADGIAPKNSAIAVPPINQASSSCSVPVLGSGFSVQSDLGCRGRQAMASNGTGNALSGARRSISMDFSTTGVLFQEGNACRERKESSPGARCPSRLAITEKQWSGRKETSSLGVERSASANGGKFFLSRFARGRSNSILPL